MTEQNWSLKSKSNKQLQLNEDPRKQFHLRAVRQMQQILAEKNQTVGRENNDAREDEVSDKDPLPNKVAGSLPLSPRVVRSPPSPPRDVGSPPIPISKVGSPPIPISKVGSPPIPISKIGSPPPLTRNGGNPSPPSRNVESPRPLTRDVGSPPPPTRVVENPSHPSRVVVSPTLKNRIVGSPPPHSAAVDNEPGPSRSSRLITRAVAGPSANKRSDKQIKSISSDGTGWVQCGNQSDSDLDQTIENVNSDSDSDKTVLTETTRRKRRISDDSDETEAVPSNPKKPLWARMYSTSEGQKILDLICDHNAFMYINGVKLWKRMESSKVLKDRTYQSLKNHFLKTVLPKVRKKKVYRISPENLKRLEKSISRVGNTKHTNICPDFVF